MVSGAMVFGMGNPAQAARRVCNTNFCIDKTADADTVEVGEQITFTITQRCPNVTVSCNSFVDLVDTLPSGLSIDSVDANAPFQPDYQCTTSGNTVTCPGGRSFDPDQSFTLTIVATTTECGTFTNTASSGSASGEVTFRVSCLPATKEQCQNGGWMDLGYPNQGACTSAVSQIRP